MLAQTLLTCLSMLFCFQVKSQDSIKLKVEYIDKKHIITNQNNHVIELHNSTMYPGTRSIAILFDKYILEYEFGRANLYDHNGYRILSGYQIAKEKNNRIFLKEKDNSLWKLMELNTYKVIIDNIDPHTYGHPGIQSIYITSNGILKGLADDNGKEILPPTYNSLFSYGNTEIGKVYYGTNKKGIGGLIDTTGKLITPLKYDRFFCNNKSLILLKHKKGADVFDLRNNKLIANYADNIKIEYGITHQIILEKGKMKGVFLRHHDTLIPCVYKDVKYLQVKGEKRYPETIILSKDNLFSGVNALTGKTIFENVNSVKLNHADYLIVTKNNETEMLDGDGKSVFTTRYEDMKHFSFHAFAPVKSNGNWGLINTAGIQTFPFIYDDIEVIESTTDVWPENIPRYVFAVKKNNQWGIVSMDGKMLLDYTYDLLNFKCEDTLGNFYFEAIKNKKAGVINMVGKIIVPVSYAYTTISTYPPLIFAGVNGKSKSYYLENGTLILKAPYEIENCFAINEHKKPEYRLLIRKNNLRGMAGTDGRILIPCAYKDIYNNRDFDSSGDEVLTLKTENNFGLADKNGKILVPVEYNHCRGAYVDQPYSVICKNKLVGLLKHNEQIILSCEYDRIDYVRETLHSTTFLLTKNNKQGLADSTGKIIIPLIYDAIYFDGNGGYYMLYNDGLMGCYTNKFTLPTKYENITHWDDANGKLFGYTFGTSQKTGLIDENGKEILPCEYGSITLIFLPDNTLLMEVTKENQTLLLNREGKSLVPFNFLFTSPVNNESEFVLIITDVNRKEFGLKKNMEIVEIKKF